MYHGVLNVYKEKGFTSHDVVAKLRGITGQRKIGHTGTLDPDAEGVLPVCLGKGTKLCEFLTDKDKTYETVLLLGRVTDTQDISGSVLSQRPVTVTEEKLREIVASFVGIYGQVPPMYSALKHNGKKLYELARAGITVERAPRQVTIYNIRILEMALPRVRLEVYCSRGTYIRTLCQDIGNAAGCGGCMEALVRTRSGQFALEDSLVLSQVEALCREGNLERVLCPPDAFFSQLPAVHTLPGGDAYVHNGNRFSPESTSEGRAVSGEVRTYDSKGQFVGIYGYEEKTGCYCPVKMFLERDQTK